MVAQRKRRSPSSTPAAASKAADPQAAERAHKLRDCSRQIVRELGLLRQDGAGLSLSQCHAVVELSQRGAMTGSQLADLLMLDRSTTSRLMAALLRAGLVAQRARAGDKRSSEFALTVAGSKRAGEIHGCADDQVGRALGALAPQDRDAALRGLELWATALRRARLRAEVAVRPIRKADNPAVAAVIRTVMPEFGASGPGFAIMDPEVDDMFGNYRTRAAYFVATRGDQVLGGAGVAALQGGPKDVCELRKMYLLPAARGLGVGDTLLSLALQAARELGFRRCYLETLSNMTQARRLYERHGFARIEGAIGRTGHFGCNTFYLREL